MPVSVLEQLIFNGLSSGFVLVLIALGLTLAFSIMDIVHFAHGEVYMLGSFTVYVFYSQLGINYLLAFVLSVALVGALGAVLERFYRPFRGNTMGSVMVSVGLALFMQSAALRGFGVEDKSLPPAFSGTLSVLGISFSQSRLAALLGAAAIILGLELFLRMTKVGQAMQATAQDPEVAALQGININNISAVCLVVASVLGAAAGALVAPLFWINPFMGTGVIVKGFMVIILGGMGSVPGALLAGLIWGMVESFGSFFVGAEWSLILSFVVVIVVLLVRPRGLLGHA